MKFSRFLMLPAVLAGLLWAGTARAQGPTGTLAGRVLDAQTNQPVASAQVVVVGSRQGVISGQDGRFVLNGVPVGAHRVRVVLLGYGDAEQAVTVTAGQIATVNFEVQPQAIALKEMVAVGYGSTRRADVTGSVASVKSDAIDKVAVASFQTGLQGNVAGVHVVQGDAAPGGGIRVQIRGVNSMNSGSAEPLYVIDGIPVASTNVSKGQIGPVTSGGGSSLTSTNPLSELAPSDIQSIEILKDASATAIYGSRGANGVVMITTKRGRAAGGSLTFSASQGYQSVIRQIPVLNAFDYASYQNAAYLNVGSGADMPYGGANRSGSLTPDSIRALRGNGINWQNEILHTAPVSDMTLSMGGADDQGDYMVSGNLLQQEGVVRGSMFRRGGMRLNLNRTVVNPRLRFSSNAAVTRSINNMVRSSTESGYQSVGVIRQALAYAPWLRLDTTKTNDPRAEDPSVIGTLGSNPLRYTDEVKELDQITRAIGGSKLTFSMGRGFAIDLSVDGNYEGRTYGNYFPRTVSEGMGSQGDAIQARTEFGNIVNENLLRFQREFGDKQRLDAVGGFTYEYDRSYYESQEARTFPDDLLGYNVLQNATDIQKPQSGVYVWQLASWLGRVNYALMDRYLFTATVRADGSSKFAENNKWATFPALAFAWRASEEPFFKNQTAVNDLKVRLSWGASGNQAIGPYQSLPSVGGVGGTPFYLGGTQNAAYALTALGNPNLRWETTKQTDIGIDMAAFNSRFTATADYYAKKTTDLLQQIQLPSNTGFSNAWLNSGEVSNKGIELQASYQILTGKSLHGLNWTISANAAHNQNRIESLGPITQQFAGRLGAGGNLEVQPFLQKPGQPIGVMYGYKTDGLIKTVADSTAYSEAIGRPASMGFYKFQDVNGDGKINSDDQTLIGDANPKWVGGMTNTFTLGRFDLSSLVTAVRGNSIINTALMTYLVMAPNQNFTNIPEYIYKNSYNPKTNPNGTYPMPNINSMSFSNTFADVFIEDGSYIRLKNVQLGYRLRLPMAQSARIYVNGTNLFTSTKYKGFDPEVSAFGGTDRPGVDQASYPGQRQVTFGVSATF